MKDMFNNLNFFSFLFFSFPFVVFSVAPPALFPPALACSPCQTQAEDYPYSRAVDYTGEKITCFMLF
jgi:hypothetical protein